MTHCGCDPEFEASPSPLFFLPFLWEWLSCLPLLTVRSLAFEGVSLSEAYCLGPVTAWAAESSDTAWIHSFIIRQMGWSRCGPCGRVPRQAPYHPTPMLASTEGAGRSACSWVKRAPRLPLPLAYSAPLFLSVSAAPSHPQWGKGGTLLSQNTHTKFECWIWQRLWNKGRLRREIKKKNLQLSGDTTVTRFYCWCDTIWKCSPAKHRFYPPPLPSLSSCSSLNFGWGPVCVTAPVQIEISTKLPRPLYLWAPSPCQLATVWDILQLPLHYGHRDFSPPPPPHLC